MVRLTKQEYEKQRDALERQKAGIERQLSNLRNEWLSAVNEQVGLVDGDKFTYRKKNWNGTEEVTQGWFVRFRHAGYGDAIDLVYNSAKKDGTRSGRENIIYNIKPENITKDA